MAVFVVVAAVIVARWRAQKELAAILEDRAEAEAQLSRLKKEYEAARADEERLRRQLDERATPKLSPHYFDSAGWRNDTGRPSGKRFRPVPVDPSQWRPEERDLVPQ